MSKAEDLAHKYSFNTPSLLLPSLHDVSLKWEKVGTEEIEAAYIAGYHQAEKDNALTWEDVQTICKIESEVDAQYCKDGVYSIPIDDVYKEVLRRFNEERNK